MTYANRSQDEEGTSILELALVLPVLILLLVMGIDLGRACYVAIETTSAAQAGAMYGIQNPADTAGMVIAAQKDAGDVSTISAVATTGCECSDGSIPTVCDATTSCPDNVLNYARIETTANYAPLIPYPGLSNTIVFRGKAWIRAAR